MRSIEWEKTNETMPGLQSGVLAQPVLAERLWLGVPRKWVRQRALKARALLREMEAQEQGDDQRVAVGQ